MKLVNLTPHDIVVADKEAPEGTRIVTTITPSGDVARVATTNILENVIEGVKYYRQKVGRVQRLPAPVPGVYYIVSSAVRMALPERSDLVSPGYPVRDGKGRQIACDGLVFTSREG